MSLPHKITEAKILVIGSEVFTLPFKLIGIRRTLRLSPVPNKEKVNAIKRELEDLIEKKEKALVIVEEEYVEYFKDLMEESRYMIYPVFLILPGPSRIDIHDPKEYYLKKIRGVLGISIELG